MPYTAISDFVLDQLLGYQTMTSLKKNIEAGVSRGMQAHELGGTLTRGVRSASYVNAPDSIDRYVDGTNLGGFTKQALVDVFTENAATSVTSKVRNVTDSTDAGVQSAPSTATSPTTQTIVLTLAAGLKRYRLMLTGSNATYDVFAKGYIEIYA